jgi:hypothetical protein
MSTVPSTNGAHPAPADQAGRAGRDLDPLTLGRIMARSGRFPDSTRESQAVVKTLAGRELGIGPFAAMSDIHLVDGTPVVGARILSALVHRSAVYDYRVVEWTNERCAIDFYRHGERLEPTVTFTDEDARRAGLDQPRPDGTPSNHTRYPRNMKFARAMSNGVALHCPDLTAGCAVYTPDELGMADADADTVASADGSAADAPTEGDGQDNAARQTNPTAGDLTNTALEGGYSAATVVELGRFYYDQPRLTELSDEQATEMAGRLRLARVQGVGDERLRRLAVKGLGMGDRPRARRAADVWLTFRAPGDTGDAAAT